MVRRTAQQQEALLRATGSALSLAQPAMGAFHRYGHGLTSLSRLVPARRVRAFRGWLRREKMQLRREAAGAADTASGRFPMEITVLTISRSDVVAKTLETLPRRRRPMHVFVLRSLPGGEGLEQARRLRSAGLDVSVHDDSESKELARRTGAVVIGADGVFRGGALTHKVGTRRLAQAAHRFGRPVYVVTGRSKFVDRRVPGRGELPSLFDVTPGRWITEFWTDAGVLTRRSLRRGMQ